MDFADLARGLFWALSLGVGLGVPLRAARLRGRNYALFAGVVLAFSLPGLLALEARLAPATGAWAAGVSLAFAAAVLAAGLHLAHLTRARLRGPGFRALVSVPGMTALAAGFLGGAWLLALWPLRLGLAGVGADGALAAFGWLDGLPLLVAGVSVVTSLRTRVERVRVPLGPVPPEADRRWSRRGAGEVLRRVLVERGPLREPPAWPSGAEAGAEPPLRVAQISDPHLGPWQPEALLRDRVTRLLAQSPDLVLLTGDFLTMEGQGSPGALARALEPLRDLPGRCYAAFGNHDHEAPEEVRSALAHCGATLLVDEARLVETRRGAVQVVGADYRRRDREAHLRSLFARHPRVPGALRLLLLHDPSAIVHVPPDEVDLTLSGHTHGGQIGLVSLGIDWTVLRGSAWPDHGLFAHGESRLYVHRGTGHYGFPLRVGVPGELSVLELCTKGLASLARDGVHAPASQAALPAAPGAV